MKNISDIDKNFQIKSVKVENMKVFDIEEKPFEIYGVYKPLGDCQFIRIPREIAEKTNDGVVFTNKNTSGGRVRFKTNSKYIALKYILPNVGMMMHMPLTGSSGFDLYADGKYIKTFMGFDFSELAKKGGEVNYESIIEFDERKLRDIVINFPLYNDVNKVYIGIEESAELLCGNKYKYKTPVVFYGSSITQGGCVSRPGNMYSSILSRRLDFDFINLGFSGSAKAEEAIAEYIAGLDMSIFVYDYDHNAESVDYLSKTHYRMYKTIRDAKPDIPIIMASRPDGNGKEVYERINVIEKTLEKAKNDGDENIYFIKGTDMFYSHDSEMMTVDGSHPNDFGSYCMAEKFEGVIKNLLK